MAMFALANRFLGPLGPIIRAGFGKKAQAIRRKRIIPRNLAIAHLMRYAITGQYPDYGIDPGAVLLSDGPILPVDHIEVQISGGMFTAVFAAQEVSEHNHDDRVRLVGYQVEDGIAIQSTVPAKRTDGQVSLTVPDHLHGKPLLIYLLVCDRHEECYSRSSYLGEFISGQ